MNHVPDQREFAPLDDQSTVDTSKNLAAEEAILGALLTNNAVLAAVPFLEAEHFSQPMNQDLFGAIRTKADANRVADPVTLMAEFKGRMVEHMTASQYIAMLVTEAAPAIHAKDYALCVLESFAIRRGLDICNSFHDRFVAKGIDETITDIIGEMEDELAGIRALSPKADTRTSIGAYLDGFLAKLSDHEQAARATIPFPLPEIASILNEDGFEPGNLYGLLASSGEGKTSLILQIVRSAAEAGHPVLVMSFDQNGQQVVRQMISQSTGITLGQMRRKGGMNDKEWEIVTRETEAFRKLPIEVVRLRQEKIGRICGQARTFAKRWSTRTDKPPLIVLDHNRKVTPDRPNDHEGRIAGAVNGAGKALAEEIGAAVLYVNQRNSGGMKRDVPRPIVSDLFGGEMSREDYDAILYLYRAEKWRDEKLKIAGSESERIKIRERFMIAGEEPENKAELGAIKVRYGNDTVREVVAWEGRLTRYVSRRQAVKELPF